MTWTKEKIKEYNKQYKHTPKGIKKNRNSQWKKNGLKESKEFIDKIYNEYLNSKECQLCGESYTKNNIKNMEHCHSTGKFRNICCKRCNLWKSDKAVKNIYYLKNIDLYNIKIFREGKYIINTTRKTKKEALKLLEETKLKYPYYFT